MKTKFTKTQKKIMKKYRSIGVLLFAVIMLIGGIIGCLFFVRPKVSEKEKRELTKFPQFTVSSFLDGSYFSEVSLWFSDTYPMRDALVSADQGIKSLYGIESDTMMVGEQAEADEIPDIDKAKSSEEASAETGGQKKKDTAENSTTENLTTEKEPLENDTTAQHEVKKVTPPDAKAMDEEFQKQVQQNLYVKDGAAYSAYYFVKDSADKYIDAVNRAAKELSGQTDVYCMLIPNQSGALLSEEELSNMGGSDQMQAIDYYYGMLEGVKTVDTIRTLRAHKDEYIYFRTDHHWTQLGAYYVYENFCKTKGITAVPLESRKSYKFENFLGTFYSTLQNSEMAKHPDTVYAYIPNGTNDLTYFDEDGTENDWNVVFDVEGWAESSLYMTFIAGDRPLEIIENPKITDGSSCLVLKESYGNAFVPLLVDHYQTVYVIDYRYAQVNVLDYIREKQIKDLILINNITIIGSDSVSATIDGLLQ